MRSTRCSSVVLVAFRLLAAERLADQELEIAERAGWFVRQSAMRSITLAFFLVASAALAQQPEPTPKPRPQNVEFNGQVLEGGRSVPLGEIYLGSPKPKFRSLIELRMNFNDKLQESVHER